MSAQIQPSTDGTTPSRTRSPAGRRSRLTLSPGLRKAVLVVHIVAAGAWIGVDVMVAVLVGVGWLADDPATQGLAYEALSEFVVVPMLVSGLLSLASGLVLGLATKWGLVRYWWVAVKLVLNLALCLTIILVLSPGMAEVGEHGRALRDGAPATADVSNLFFPPTVSLTALTLATVLSVVKPWGRVRRPIG